MSVNLDKLLNPISAKMNNALTKGSNLILPIVAALQITYSSDMLAASNNIKNRQDVSLADHPTMQYDGRQGPHLEDIALDGLQRDTTKNSGNIDDDCDCDPKYKRLEFRRKAVPTFQSKEIWTLNNGKGTDLFSIDCNNLGGLPLENILELVDFTDKRAKQSLMTGKYDVVLDRHGRRFAKIETNVGTRYFTIQSRDKDKEGAIGIDGKINYERLESFGNTVLRLYIGTAKAVQTKKGLEMRFEDSGDLLIPYFKCCEEVPPEKTEDIKTQIDTVIKSPTIPYEKMLSEARKKIEDLDAMQQKYLEMISKLENNTLQVDVIGGIANTLDHEEDCGCSTIDMDNNVRLFEISTYGKIDNRLQLNASINSIHGRSDLKDMAGDDIGKFEITSSQFNADARMALLNISALGIGPGVMFDHTSTTQRGNAKDINLNAGDGRYALFIGPVVSYLEQGGDLSLGIYYGYSKDMGNIAKAVLRANNVGLDEFSFDAHAFYERYYADRGTGNRVGVDVRVAGPQLIGFLSPVLGLKSEGLVHFYDNNRVSTGTLNSIYIGVRGNLGRFLLD